MNIKNPTATARKKTLSIKFYFERIFEPFHIIKSLVY